ncbi:tetratricopeptide repeat protein [Amycolatopsis pigmentata]|uniref:Tetratricopeptide repeat protein n=1 Tax=Amycolatopsis pigmentata TaxID=450801 RepID=A0ABW5G112_9PSEU
MNVFHDLVDFVAQIVAVALVFLVTAFLTRAGTAIWRRVRHGGTVPLVVHGTGTGGPETRRSGGARLRRTGPPTDGTGRDVFQTVVSMLRAYIAEDVRGRWTITPGTPNMATPEIPAEAPKTSDGWVAALYALTAPARPGYHISLMELPSMTGGIRVSVQIVHRPGDTVIAARTFATGPGEDLPFDDLVNDIGGFCVEQVQQQAHVLHRTPRWEQWADRRGYTEFRRGLANETRGATNEALACYNRASSQSLGNVTLALRMASILEREGRFADAMEIYGRIQELWPESIEATYRCAAVCSNARVTGRADYDRARRMLDGVRDALRPRVLFVRWLKSWSPGRSNLGERIYWSSWLRPWRAPRGRLFSRRSKRRDYLWAVKVARAVVDLAEQCDAGWPTGRADTAEFERNWRKVGRYLATPRVGWLAHYNGACFYALCAGMSVVGDGPIHRDRFGDCVDRALRQLASIVRDPFNDLDPRWLLTDPDMQALKEDLGARKWARFIGVDLDGPDGVGQVTRV